MLHPTHPLLRFSPCRTSLLSRLLSSLPRNARGPFLWPGGLLVPPPPLPHRPQRFTCSATGWARWFTFGSRARSSSPSGGSTGGPWSPSASFSHSTSLWETLAPPWCLSPSTRHVVVLLPAWERGTVRWGEGGLLVVAFLQCTQQAVDVRQSTPGLRPVFCVPYADMSFFFPAPCPQRTAHALRLIAVPLLPCLVPRCLVVGYAIRRAAGGGRRSQVMRSLVPVIVMVIGTQLFGKTFSRARKVR